MKTHEAAELFPLMVGAEFQELVNSIKANGLLKPIELYGGMLLDGRNRYKACQEAGVPHRFIDIPETTDPFEYVWAINAERRHLAQGQKGVIYELQQRKSAQWKEERDRRQEEANRARSESQVGISKEEKKRERELSRDNRRSEPKTHEKSAQATGASTATQARAQALVNKRPDLAEKVASGETTLTNATRIAKKEELKEAVPLPPGKFRVFYVDPPWKYSDTRLGLEWAYGPAENHYPPMTITELCAMEIPADENAVMFLWTTSPMLEVAFKVLKAWKFQYKTSFVWYKKRHNFGHYNSVRHEFLLIATRGSCTPGVSKLFDSVVSIEREAHSAKPEYFYEIIETIYPEEMFGKALELFRRSNEPPRPGWVGWGNEN